MPRRHTRPVQERKPPFSVGLALGKAMPHADVVAAEGTPGVSNVLACANTRAGSTPWLTLLTEATAQTAPTGVTVGGEATGPDGLSRYEARTAQGSPGLVRTPVYVKARRGTTWRGTKTDPVDARLMAEMLPREQGPVSPVPEAEVPGLRDVTRRRAALVAQVGDVQRRMISLLDRTFPACATGVSEVCGPAARPLLATWTVPEARAAVPTARRAAVRARLSHGHLGAETAREVNAAAQQRLGVKRAAAALALARRWRWRQSRAVERLVAEWAPEISRRYAAVDPWRRTVPGWGAAPAPAIEAEIGDIQRFTDADPLVAWAGVDPQRHASGQTAGQPKLSPRGSPSRRRAVWPAALTACRDDPRLRAIDDRQRQRGTHQLVALSPVANTRRRVISAVLKGQRPYDPNDQGQTSHP